MRGDEVVLAAFRSRSNPVPAKHVSDRLVRNLVTARHLYHQALYLTVNPRPARVGPVLRAIELSRDQLPEPAENRLRFCDFRQTLSPESLPDPGQSGAFRIREPQPAWRQVTPWSQAKIVPSSTANRSCGTILSPPVSSENFLHVLHHDAGRLVTYGNRTELFAAC
jgi:hypothetical protein